MKAGVITGDLAWSLLRYAKEKQFAIPAFNCTSTSSVNTVLEAGRALNRPIMIQFSEGGSAFFAGKSLQNNKKQGSVLGAVAGAFYVRAVAPAYGIPVLVHSDHCAKKLLPWFDGMLEFDKSYFKANGEPLFSSHMLDLSEEPHEENIGICRQYLEQMAPINLILEMEIGITGGVEDGVDKSGLPFLQSPRNSPSLQLLEMCMACTNLGTWCFDPSCLISFSNMHKIRLASASRTTS